VLLVPTEEAEDRTARLVHGCAEIGDHQFRVSRLSAWHW